MNFSVAHEGDIQGSRTAEIYEAEKDKARCMKRGRMS
jgi:hypothetical protein